MAKYGIATDSSCPKAGFMRLINAEGESVLVKTTCKTKSCKGCRERVTKLVKKRIVSGCLKAAPCFFITVTYRLDDQSSPMDAASVNQDFTELVRGIKKSWPNLCYFKVIEMTKRGQPHLHLIVGGIGNNRVGCCENPAKDKRCGHRFSEEWANRYCLVNCVEHEWAALWLRTTGDSFVVNAKPVYSNKKAAAYLAKYVTKASNSDQLAALGFRRAWTRSRNWPGVETLENINTKEKKWIKTQFHPASVATLSLDAAEVANGIGSRLLNQTGTSGAWEDWEATETRRKLAVIKRMKNASHR